MPHMMLAYVDRVNMSRILMLGLIKDLRKTGYGDRDLNCEILSMFIFAYTVQS